MESSVMKDRLDDSWGSTSLIVLWMLLMMIVGICILPFSLAAHGLRAIVIAHKQRRATGRLATEQQNLLKRLWEAENDCRRYSEAYGRGYFDVHQACNAAIQRADDLIKECQQAGINDWRIRAFRITSHDYWWWF